MSGEKKVLHKDFKEHSFDKFIDMGDQGEKIEKIYECECGARMIEVFTRISERYEKC